MLASLPCPRNAANPTSHKQNYVRSTIWVGLRSRVGLGFQNIGTGKSYIFSKIGSGLQLPMYEIRANNSNYRIPHPIPYLTMPAQSAASPSIAASHAPPGPCGWPVCHHRLQQPEVEEKMWKSISTFSAKCWLIFLLQNVGNTFLIKILI